MIDHFTLPEKQNCRNCRFRIWRFCAVSFTCKSVKPGLWWLNELKTGCELHKYENKEV